MKISRLLCIVYILISLCNIVGSHQERVLIPALLVAGWKIVVASAKPAAKAFATSAAKELLKGLFGKKPNNEELKGILQELQKSVQLLGEIKVVLQELPEEIRAILEEMKLYDKFIEIRALWTRMYHFLDTFNKGRYPDKRTFDRDFDDLVDAIANSIFQNVEWIDVDIKVEPYLEKYRMGMVQNKTDLATYSIKLSYAIEDYLEIYSKAIDLLIFAGSRSPYLASYVGDIEGYIEKLTAYKAKHIRGSWFPVIEHLLKEGGDESVFMGLVMKHYGTLKHLVTSQSTGALDFGLPLLYFIHYHGRTLWMDAASETPFWIVPTSDSNFGSFYVNIFFEVDGNRKLIGSSHHSERVGLDFEIQGSEKWSLVPCQSKLLENAESLDYICIVNAVSGRYLTLEFAESDYTCLRAFSETSPHQIWTVQPMKRCCDLYEEADFKGTRVGICLGANETFKEFDSLPEGMKSIGSIKCSGAEATAREGEKQSGREIIVREGTQVASFDPAKISTIQSIVVESRCSRIFTSTNFTGEYRTICQNLASLGEIFVGKNTSIAIADKPIQVFELPGHQGKSMTFRKSGNIENLDFSIMSAKILDKEE